MLIHNKRFGGKLDAERAALLAVFHDSTEIITGDMPTLDAYKQIEEKAADRLVSLLPEDFQEEYEAILKQSGEQDEQLRKFVKAADRYSALIKCIEEMRMGNDEFRMAKETIQKSIDDMGMPETKVFEEEFLPSFYLALDELE